MFNLRGSSARQILDSISLFRKQSAFLSDAKCAVCDLTSDAGPCLDDRPGPGWYIRKTEKSHAVSWSQWARSFWFICLLRSWRRGVMTSRVRKIAILSLRCLAPVPVQGVGWFVQAQQECRCSHHKSSSSCMTARPRSRAARTRILIIATASKEL